MREMLFPIISEAAAATDFGSPGWGSLIATGGGFSLVCYLLYWLVTKNGPEKDRMTADVITGIGKNFEGAVNKVTDTFTNEMKQQRDNCREERDAIIELLRGEKPKS